MSCENNGKCDNTPTPSPRVIELVAELQKVMEFGTNLPTSISVDIQEFHDHTIIRNALAFAYQKVADMDDAWSKALRVSCANEEFRKKAQAYAE